MKKIIGILGAIVGLIGVIFQFFDKTMGWWEADWTTTPIIGSVTTESHYFNLLGELSSSSNNNNYPIVLADKTIITLILIIVLAGCVCLFIGGAKGNTALGILGTLLLIGGIVYFAYSLPNIPEMVSELHHFNPPNYLFGSGDWNFIIADIKNSWRLGNGFFITSGGAILGFIGSAMKE
jgi:hypothetical protein